MLLRSHLASLEKSGLIRLAQIEPDLAYLFRHTMVQETAYQTLLTQQRKAIHLRVAEIIEVQSDGKSEEAAPVLAYHYDHAGQEDKALHYHTIAADAALGQYANAEAIHGYRRALAFARDKSHDREQLTHLFINLGRARELSGDYDGALETYSEMCELAEQRGDDHLLLTALTAQTTAHAIPSGKFDLEKVEALSKRALILAERVEDPEAEARIYWNLMLGYQSTVEMEKAAEYGEKALAIARQNNLTERTAYVLNDLANVYMNIKKRDKALAAHREAQRLFRQLDNKAMLTDTLSSAAVLTMIEGDFDTALARSEEAYVLSDEINNSWGKSFSLYIVPWVQAERGNYAEALEAARECIRLGEQSDFLIPSHELPQIAAMIHVELGDYIGAKEWIKPAITVAEEHAPLSAYGPQSVLALIAIREGELVEAEQMLAGLQSERVYAGTPSIYGYLLARCYLPLYKNDPYGALVQVEGALDTLKELGLAVFSHEPLLIKARALRALDRPEEAHAALTQAHELAESLDARRTLWQILAELAEIEEGRGEHKHAWDMRRRAAKIIDHIAEHAGSQMLKESFLAREEVERVLEG